MVEAQKVINDCIGFAFPRAVIGPENSCQPLNQSNAALKPVTTRSLAFSRAKWRLHVTILRSHWLRSTEEFSLECRNPGSSGFFSSPLPLDQSNVRQENSRDLSPTFSHALHVVWFAFLILRKISSTEETQHIYHHR